MKVAIIGTGNVGMAIAADLSCQGHECSLIKSSSIRSGAYDRLLLNNHWLWLKEKGDYIRTKITEVTQSLEKVSGADVVFVTIQSTYHEQLYQRMGRFLNKNQLVIIVCSYLSSFYLRRFCEDMPMVAETTGPYLEGRVVLDDKPNEVVFRVGCRLSNSPLSLYYANCQDKAIRILKSLNKAFYACYTPIESALLNPNMVLHTVGAIMSIPRIEYSEGNFCMYREAYSRKNNATINIMLQLDEEKKNVLKILRSRPIDIYEAGGFLGNPEESFFSYSESNDRAISPTSIHSRYITEDVSQGLVLLESIAKLISIDVPITTSLINVASAALQEDFRGKGRTVQKLHAKAYIELLKG